MKSAIRRLTFVIAKPKLLCYEKASTANYFLNKKFKFFTFKNWKFWIILQYRLSASVHASIKENDFFLNDTEFYENVIYFKHH